MMRGFKQNSVALVIFGAIAFSLPVELKAESLSDDTCDWEGIANPSNCTLVQASCTATAGSLVVVNAGNETTQYKEDLCEACTAACGDPYATQPSPVTCTMDVEITFTESLESGITFGREIGAEAYFISAKESIEVSIGATEGKEVKSGSGMSVTVPSCEWQTGYAQMVTVTGTHKKQDHTISGFKEYDCPNGTVRHFIDNETVTVWAKGDVVKSKTANGAKENGSCPDDPFPSGYPVE